MPIVAITTASHEGIEYQWFTHRGSERHTSVLRWDEVAAVDAFKRDLGTVDLLCLQLTDHRQGVIEIDEEDFHWDSLLETLPEHLVGCAPLGDWFADVTFPAFAEKRRRIFQRSLI